VIVYLPHDGVATSQASAISIIGWKPASNAALLSRIPEPVLR
jgi:hypothetical protein